MKTNTRKLVLNSLLLAMGLLLHQLTPVLGFPIQPDIAIAMLFIIMVLNKDDYKTCLVAGIVTGIFAALTTKFPGGQIPNIVDKFITVNIVYMIMFIIYKLPLINKMNSKNRDFIVLVLIFPLGTFISGCIFLISAKIIVGLPQSFTALFLVAVAPAILINLIVGTFLFRIVNISIKRLSYQSVNK